MRIICSCCLFLLLIGPVAQAHLPDYHMIMSRTAETHGRGLYQIEQDVVFRGDPDPLVVHETWWISGEYAMRVTFEGRGSLKGQAQGAFIYDNSQRHWRDENGALKTARLGEDWLEPLFHFRFSKNIKPRLVALQIAPAESLRDRHVQVTPNKETGPEYKYTPQSFMRLARTGGTVSYAIGTPTPPDESSSMPGIWIEQDQFVVRKIRTPSQALVTAEDYTRHPENLWLPRSRNLSWGTHSVQIHVGTVRPLGRQPRAAEVLKTSSLDAQKNPTLMLRLPEIDSIREFYQRFR
ncbi:MAG: hypothetical protein AB7N80_11820 [Bdellovibrionales bacterium]